MIQLRKISFMISFRDTIPFLRKDFVYNTRRTSFHPNRIQFRTAEKISFVNSETKMYSTNWKLHLQFTISACFIITQVTFSIFFFI